MSRPWNGRLAPTDEQPLVLAHYLPQFHPVAENDAFWGPGFSDWRTMAASQPRFEGHRQPRLPGELGFYDLRLAETRHRQAELARNHGIDGFVYYHYWFEGRRILETPFEEVRACGEPDFPFALCWANESWDDVWNDREEVILVEQRYSEQDDQAHARHLAEVFGDPRYLRFDGRPLLFIYRAHDHPDPNRFVETLAAECSRVGIDRPWITSIETRQPPLDPFSIGADASLEFFPHLPLDWWGEITTDERGRGDDLVVSYDGLRRLFEGRPQPAWPRYPQVVPDWDNSARRPHARSLLIADPSPADYEAWLRSTLQRQIDEQPTGRRMVLVNAWNEWAEGACLEPDLAGGRANLEATRRAVESCCDENNIVPRPAQANGSGGTQDGSDNESVAASTQRRLDLVEANHATLSRQHADFLAMMPRIIRAQVASVEQRLDDQRRSNAKLLDEISRLEQERQRLLNQQDQSLSIQDPAIRG